MKPLKEYPVRIGMKRRELLSGLGAGFAATSLGGCLGRYRDAIGDGGDDPADATEETSTGEDTTAGDGTSTDEETTTGRGATLASTSFKLLKRNCGAPTNDASVAFGEREVTVA